MKKAKIILSVFGVLVFIAFTPMVSFVFTPFSALGMGIGIIIFLLGIYLPAFLKWTKKHRVLTTILAIFLAIALLWALFCSVLLLISGTKAPRGSDTVIVLGCLIKGDQPSRMLKQRLEKAYDYLSENPNAVAIMSGGQGPDEIKPEAVVMYDYLVQRGVSADRLYIEPNSHNTQQNMEYSARIIEENGLDTDVVVITQAFHQYRASVYAERAGLNSYAINCKTNIGTLPTYWFRELFGIVKMYLVLLGN